jgi:serine/threonine protein kinase
MALTPGTRLVQYQIVAPLGSGGMGEVYRARDERLGRDVAIKVMAAHVAAQPEMRARFETEARAVAALSHPSIVSIHELAIVDDVPIAVMELLEGETLRERLKKGPIEWREALEIGAAVADGLSAAHAKGVIHRDLKPENVFLTSEGGVKVLDFGLALHRMDAESFPDNAPTLGRTAQGVVLGTFGYMSPEQVTGSRVDGRSDIFALGCLLYEMLTGRRLVGGSTPQEILAHVLHDSVPDFSGVDPLAPAELRSIVARCVDRTPSRRFESARDLAMALRALLTGSAAGAPGRRPRPRGKSIAVLPFVNAAADPQVEYLADGITESIINSLSQLGGVRVVPRSLVFRYKGLQSDPATVGLALNARTILTGRIVQHGDMLTIQAELVDTTTESQLWGDQYRQRVSDLMAVQQEIAWHITEGLRLKVTVEQKKKLRRQPTVDPEAYQEYLRGRYHWNIWTPESFRKALEHFERAIVQDPAYALAYAGLGDLLGSMAFYGFIPAEDGFPRARAAADRALELEPEIADAHVTLALGHLFYERDWAASEREFKTAIRLNPQLPLAHGFFSLYLSAVSRHDEAIAHARKAQQLDPLSLLPNMSVCWALHFAGRHEEVMREALRMLEFAPAYEEAGNVLSNAYEALGRYEDAVEVARRQPLFGVPADADALLAAYRKDGARGYWQARLDQMNATSRPLRNLDFAYAVAYAQLGRIDDALDSLERVMKGSTGVAVFAPADPCLKELRGNPRYDAIVERLGMPAASAPRVAT